MQDKELRFFFLQYCAQAVKREQEKIAMYGDDEIIVAKSKRFTTGFSSTIGTILGTRHGAEGYCVSKQTS